MKELADRQTLEALKEEVERAFKEAELLPPDERLQLMQRLLAECDSLVARREAGSFLGLFLLTILASGAVYANLSILLPVFLMASVIGIPGFAYYMRRKSDQAMQALKRLLERCPDTRLIPTLLTIDIGLSEVKENSFKNRYMERLRVRRTLLKILLPHLQPGEASAWTPQQMESAALLLEWPHLDMGCTLELVRAAKRIGDPMLLEKAYRLRHFPVVSTLLNQPLGAAGKEYHALAEMIEQAALDCAPERTLLRTSDASSVAPREVLLRPATGTSVEIPTEQLLRPSTGQE